MNEAAEAAVRPSRWKEIWEIALRNKLTLTGFAIVALVVLVGLLAPVLAPYDPNEINIPARLQAPGAEHLFGTDEMAGTSSPASCTARASPSP